MIEKETLCFEIVIWSFLSPSFPSLSFLLCLFSFPGLWSQNIYIDDREE